LCESAKIKFTYASSPFMPFTFSHPALVLPLLRKRWQWLSASGLVVGSVVPDFEYFLRMRKGISWYSHTWAGLFWFDLPMGLLVMVVFHRVVRKPLLTHLPALLQKRLRYLPAFSWRPNPSRKCLVIILSILLGTLSHFGWDWAVHQGADYLYQHQSTLFSFEKWKRHNQLYAPLHLSQTLLGLAAIGTFIAAMPATEPATQHKSTWLFWLSILLLTLFLAGARVTSGQGLDGQDMLVSVIAAFLFSLTLVCYYCTVTR
jgi:hypothetical protein